MLDQYGIVVWRDHDYIHSGIPLENGIYTDGIFCGLMMELGWKEYLTCNVENPLRFTLPETTVRGLGEELKRKLNLRGIKVIGSPDSPVRSVWVPGHIDGREDNQILQTVEEENIDTIITLECTDYTVAEYVRDSTMAGRPKTILAVGHFNSEEPGMRCMVQYLPQAAQTDVPCLFIPSTDMYHFI
ncbi:MAG: Nif3-like dinuclear metal center hexameric protein [Lachnospiraceae bacterium]|nr:Nif3-like dinuclear metal center hexameric protein [Lachnospiraceae bacterium]